MPPAIQTEQLTKDFSIGFWRVSRRRALNELTLAVQPGEVFGFLGPNGTGKTTTLKLLLRLLFPSSGRAWVLDKPAGDLDARRRIAFLPEHPYFYDYLTAEELLDYFGSLFGYSAAERRRRTVRCLDDAGIGGERQLALRHLSKGLIQRVGIAQALLNDPEVLFLDEPMSGLDPLGRRDIRALILDLRDRGTTVFFSSHILSDAEALCSRVAIVAGGRLATMGRLAEMAGYELRGWEIVVTGLRPEVAKRLEEQGIKATAVSDGRYTLELPKDARPESVVSDVSASGAALVSVSPLHTTLEEIFVQQVAKTTSARKGAL
jgi:ABC-2 type transport system ATP-binding protein